MNINISEVEKNTAVLLSSTTSFIMNAMSGLYDEIQRYDEALNECFFNFHFLYTKINCPRGIENLLMDFEEIEHVNSIKELKILRNLLRLAASFLEKNPQMLGPQIIARLLPFYKTSPVLMNLIYQCDSVGLQYCALVPIHHCQSTPGGPMGHSFEGSFEISIF